MSFVNIKEEVKDKPLTNGELIELLQTLPKDAMVCHEGCDCWGDADRVEYDEEENIILIGRCDN